MLRSAHQQNHRVRWSSALAPVAAALGLIGAAQSSMGQSPANDSRLRVVIAGFALAAGQDERDSWIPTALEETIAWRLRRVPQIVCVPTVRVHQARREIDDSASDAVEWPRVARALGATHLLTGTCRGTPASLTIEVELRPLASSDIGAAASESLPPARLSEALDAATRWSLSALKAGALEPQTQALVFAPASSSPTALEYYAKAVIAARADNPRDTVYYAEEALAFDQRFRPALSLLAQIEMRGPPATVRSAMARLHALAALAAREDDPLDRAEAELSQATIAALSGSFDAAIQRAENALTMSYAGRDVYGQIAAMNRICDLHLTRQPVAGDELESAARQRFELNKLRRAAEWQSALLGALATLSDAVGETPAANKLGLIYERLGESDLALAAHERTLAAATLAGSQRNQATALLYISQLHRAARRWSEAASAAQRCLDLAPPQARPVARISLAGIYADMDRPDEALRQFEQAYAEVQASDDLANQYVCLREMADLRFRLDARAKAVETLQEAIDVAHALDLPEEEALRVKLAEWQAVEVP